MEKKYRKRFPLIYCNSFQKLHGIFSLLLLCCKIWSWDLAISVSIESFLYEWLVIVISLLFEADKITTTDTQSKSAADAVAIDQSNKRENVVDILQMRLNDYNLEMEETAGDGNCFFRAVSRMVYASDEFYLNVRSQAIEKSPARVWGFYYKWLYFNR